MHIPEYNFKIILKNDLYISQLSNSLIYVQNLIEDLDILVIFFLFLLCFRTLA